MTKNIKGAVTNCSPRLQGKAFFFNKKIVSTRYAISFHKFQLMITINLHIFYWFTLGTLCEVEKCINAVSCNFDIKFGHKTRPGVYKWPKEEIIKFSSFNQIRNYMEVAIFLKVIHII